MMSGNAGRDKVFSVGRKFLKMLCGGKVQVRAASAKRRRNRHAVDCTAAEKRHGSCD
jgi:hypothetical protein